MIKLQLRHIFRYPQVRLCCFYKKAPSGSFQIVLGNTVASFSTHSTEKENPSSRFPGKQQDPFGLSNAEDPFSKPLSSTADPFKQPYSFSSKWFSTDAVNLHMLSPQGSIFLRSPLMRKNRVFTICEFFWEAHNLFSVRDSKKEIL